MKQQQQNAPFNERKPVPVSMSQRPDEVRIGEVTFEICASCNEAMTANGDLDLLIPMTGDRMRGIVEGFNKSPKTILRLVTSDDYPNHREYRLHDLVWITSQGGNYLLVMKDWQNPKNYRLVDDRTMKTAALNALSENLVVPTKMKFAQDYATLDRVLNIIKEGYVEPETPIPALATLGGLTMALRRYEEAIALGMGAVSTEERLLETALHAIDAIVALRKREVKVRS